MRHIRPGDYVRVKPSYGAAWSLDNDMFVVQDITNGLVGPMVVIVNKYGMKIGYAIEGFDLVDGEFVLDIAEN